ncbi:MAG: M20/M25/M40 family metallo-hydrolase [Woeseiaceae bacterium]|nr:M20/M25/M40 family metallo-hydrolase [Woeseiaceae bacterium]
MRTLLLRASMIVIALQIAAACAADDGDFAHEVLAELLALNTAPSGGNDLRPTVELLIGYFEEAGFDDADIQVVESSPTQPNLVVRLRSPSAERPPILMMAHLDVVEALREDWTVEPYRMTEQDGYYYGRGATDNKAGAAMLVANLIRYRNEGFEPNRDLIVMLTADEETTGKGALLLANEYRELIDAEFALNTDGGLVMMRDGRAGAFIMQTSEKVYVTYRLEALDPGGHSSLPRSDNPISRIARTLAALHEFRFPIDLNETTRTFFERWATLAPPEDRSLIAQLLSGEGGAELSAALDRNPYYNALARTTCVATQVSGGHAENALPQTATAVINCRVLPQSPTDGVRATLRALAEPNGVSITETYSPMPSPPSPLDPDIVEPIESIAQEFWPGIVLIPEMSTGATDGLFVRNVGIPVYGISAIAEDPDDIRAHGQDERIRIDAFDDATEFWYRLVKRLASE